MTDAGELISRSESGWSLQVGTEQIELPADTTPDVVAGQFAQLCDSVNQADKRCVLGLAADECFFADFELPATIDAKDHGAITYELERHFPLDAEAMVSEHRYDASRGRIAALAIATKRQREIIDALEAVGIEVVSIIPTAFLIARALRQRGQATASFQLLLFHESAAELLTVDADGIQQWRQFYDPDDELRRHQSIIAGRETTSQDTANQNVVVVGRTELRFETDWPVQYCDATAKQLAAAGAKIALRGRWGRWPDLRRGALAPGDPLFAVATPLRWLAVAAAGCFLVLSIAAWYRGERLAEASESIRQQQRSAFQAAFPGRRVPMMLMRNVRSEHRKTLGSRGRGETVRMPIPATNVLRDLYRGLDHAQRVDGAKMRVIDLQINDGECSLTVRAVDSVHIGSIAKSLETVGFEVAPPASLQIEPSDEEPIATYQSTITAIWNANGDAS